MFLQRKFKITIFSLVLLLGACVRREDNPTTGYNEPVDAIVLFESPEGCKLYKVHDTTPGGDSYVYSPVCSTPNTVSPVY